MPSSSGTFSSRNRAVGQAQRERGERGTSADPLFQLPGIKIFPLLCDASCRLSSRREEEEGEDADERPVE